MSRSSRRLLLMGAALACATSLQAAVSPSAILTRGSSPGPNTPLYEVRNGNQVDARTLAGWRAWRAMACARCHGAEQEGLVGPSLIESLKKLDEPSFDAIVLEGRPEKGMPAFKRVERLQQNLGGLYAYLQGRSRNAISPGPLVLLEGEAETSRAGAPDTAPLRVCADDNALPRSNARGEGYENRIAAALARDLRRPLEYSYFPQRLGFVRNTLRARDEVSQHYKCDVIIGVPRGFEKTATTHPYMHSIYTLVAPASAGLGTLRSPDELLALPSQRLHALRVGAVAHSPAVDWMLREGLMQHAVFYPLQSGEPGVTPEMRIERDLAAGRLDLAILWGPAAGYIAGRHAAEGWWMAPLAPDPKLKLDFEICMGVRAEDSEWLATLDGWIQAHGAEIRGILGRYHVPLLPE